MSHYIHIVISLLHVVGPQDPINTRTITRWCQVSAASCHQLSCVQCTEGCTQGDSKLFGKYTIGYQPSTYWSHLTISVCQYPVSRFFHSWAVNWHDNEITNDRVKRTFKNILVMFKADSRNSAIDLAHHDVQNCSV